jgi:hypothetical protein
MQVSLTGHRTNSQSRHFLIIRRRHNSNEESEQGGDGDPEEAV